MENATEALKMAAAVIMFVMALSVAIISYGQVRKTSDSILDMRDRETEYIDGNFYYETTGTERTVGLETIIPTIYRVYYENYRIVFTGSGMEDTPIYTNIGGNANDKRFSLDLAYEKNILNGQDLKKIEILLNAIVYGKSDTEYENLYLNKVRLPGKSLYERLKEKISQGYKIKEYLGVYYQNDNPDVPEANKLKKRVITYEITQ